MLKTRYIHIVQNSAICINTSKLPMKYRDQRNTANSKQTIWESNFEASKKEPWTWLIVSFVVSRDGADIMAAFRTLFTQ